MENRKLLIPAILLGLLAPLLVLVGQADEGPGGVRAAGSIAETLPAPPMSERPARQSVPRAWPQQPPVIPHEIRDYQMDRRHNRCLDCHQGAGPELTGATAISATHYINRDGEALDRLAGARHFCTLCHVPQRPVSLLTESRFGLAPTALEEDES